MIDAEPAIELDDFTDEVVQLTRALTREYRLQDRDELFCHDVTVLQWETLDAIARLGKATMNEISGAMSLANSTMTRVIDQLVEKQLVERQANREDRRVVRVILTPAGEEKLADVRQCIRDSQRPALGYIAPQERGMVLWALRQLWEARERWRGSCCRRIEGQGARGKGQGEG